MLANKLIVIIVVIMIVLKTSNCESYAFLKQLKCINSTATMCNRWNQTAKLLQSVIFLCFPQDTVVLAEDGPIKIHQVKIGDKLWSHNLENGEQEYSEVVAWLHKDLEAKTDYNRIETSQGKEFFISAFHNVAYKNGSGDIDFKFAEKLEKGEELIAFGTSKLEITKNDEKEEKKGFYSPLTKNRNYFIFQSDIEEDHQEIMMLVHCLSQVNNPQTKNHITENFIHYGSYLGLNREPNPDEDYTHPLMSEFNFLYGKDWENHVSIVKYDIDLHPNHHLAHDQFRSRPSFRSSSRPSFGRSSSFGRRSSFGRGSNGLLFAGAGIGGGYAGHNRQRQHARKAKQALTLSISMLSNPILTN